MLSGASPLEKLATTLPLVTGGCAIVIELDDQSSGPSGGDRKIIRQASFRNGQFARRCIRWSWA